MYTWPLTKNVGAFRLIAEISKIGVNDDRRANVWTKWALLRQDKAENLGARRKWLGWTPTWADATSQGVTTRTNNDMLEFGQTYTTSRMRNFSIDTSTMERNWKRFEYEMLSKIKPQNILCLDVWKETTLQQNWKFCRLDPRVFNLELECRQV